MTHLATAFRLASAGLVLLIPSSTDAQDPPCVPSQILLKRLAEAVDGNRHGENIYIVSRYDSLSPIAGVFRERREADEYARRMGRNHDVFGPYRYQASPSPYGTTPREPPARELRFGGCVHDGRSSMWICPQPTLPLDSIEGISLTFRMRDGTTHTVNPPRSTDAVFLSIPAIDKFVIPYYARIIGLDAAVEMRRDIVNRVATSRAP